MPAQAIVCAVSADDEDGEPSGAGLQIAGELYARPGTPCATCTSSFMTIQSSRGTVAGFSLGAGLTLRVCRKGREPLVVLDGAADALWCEDYSGFTSRMPLSADEVETFLSEASRGFVGDLAQGIRPMPRALSDLPWYDRGLREGWLPPHRIEEGGGATGPAISGPWEQFHAVGVTPAFGDGHAPAVGRAVLQARDRSSYVLPDDADGETVRGAVHPHTWWVNQVSAGAAIPFEAPVQAHRGGVVLVLRGGERILRRHAFVYCSRAKADSELDSIAEDSLRQARAALRRGDPVVAGLCARRGLTARPDHPELRQLASPA